MDEIDQINNAIWKLWKNHPREAGSVVPKFVMSPKPENVVFLGLNPSLPKKLHSEAREWISDPTKTQLLDLLEMRQEQCWYPKCFNWEQSNLNKAYFSEIASAYAEIHYGARDYYGKRWFRRLNEIAKKAEIKSYGHVDLFLCLNASFKCLPPEYHAPENHTRFSKPNFVQSQLDLAYELLLKLQPKIVIAVYKSAAEIFLRYHASVPGCQPNEMCRQFLLEGQLLEKINLCLDGRAITFLACSNLPYHRSKKKADEMVKKIVDEIRRCCIADKK